MEWIKYHHLNPPPQGRKIVCFKKGDLWVARRLNFRGKDYYLEIPYGGSMESILTLCPEYWMKLDLPDGYTGYMKVGVNGMEPMELDELQVVCPETHDKWVETMVKRAKRNKNE